MSNFVAHDGYKAMPMKCVSTRDLRNRLGFVRELVQKEDLVLTATGMTWKRRRVWLRATSSPDSSWLPGAASARVRAGRQARAKHSHGRFRLDRTARIWASMEPSMQCSPMPLTCRFLKWRWRSEWVALIVSSNRKHFKPISGQHNVHVCAPAELLRRMP